MCLRASFFYFFFLFNFLLVFPTWRYNFMMEQVTQSKTLVNLPFLFIWGFFHPLSQEQTCFLPLDIAFVTTLDLSSWDCFSCSRIGFIYLVAYPSLLLQLSLLSVFINYTPEFYCKGILPSWVSCPVQINMEIVFLFPLIKQRSSNWIKGICMIMFPDFIVINSSEAWSLSLRDHPQIFHSTSLFILYVWLC